MIHLWDYEILTLFVIGLIIAIIFFPGMTAFLALIVSLIANLGVKLLLLIGVIILIGAFVS